MSKQVYFVVAVDVDSKEVIIDDETLIARFPEGTVWDDEVYDWGMGTASEVEEATAILKAGF